MMAGVQISSDEVTAKIAKIETNQKKLETDIEKSIKQMARNIDTIDQLSDSVVAKEPTAAKSGDAAAETAESTN
jgi:hypothetical protein